MKNFRASTFKSDNTKGANIESSEHTSLLAAVIYARHLGPGMIEVSVQLQTKSFLQQVCI